MGKYSYLLVFSIILVSFFPLLVFGESGTITGTITDAETGDPLPGANVLVVGTLLGGAAGTDGEYTITGVPAGENRLEARFVGYRTIRQTVTVAADERLEVNFEMAQTMVRFDEIVVTGVGGEVAIREIGHSISRLNIAELEFPGVNVDDMLSGRVPSMTVNPGSGTMGAGAAIRLRGNTSISQSNQPLVYIDGIRQSSDTYPLNASQGAAFWQTPQSTASPLNDINPLDIERVEIIKGASATTLYGSEAASGVIQMFTKRGEAGAPRWTYQTNQRIARVQPFGSDENPYLNMKPFYRTAYGQQHVVSVSGGVRDVNYYISALYDKGQGIKLNDKEERYAIRGNFGMRPSASLSLDWHLFYSDHDLQITQTGNNLYSLEFNAFRAPGGPVGTDDPDVIAELLDAYVTQNNVRFSTSINARHLTSANLINRVIVGLDRMSMDGRHITPFGFILLSGGSIAQQNWVSQALTLDYMGTYSVGISNDLRMRLSWGGQYISHETVTLDGWGTGLPGPGEHTLSSAASRLTFSSEFRVIDAGAFTEASFNYRDRAFFTIGTRVDGNSQFGEDLGLQVYPKFSTSYVISDAAFWPGVLADEMRLRLAFGMAGRAPGPFDAVRTWNPITYAGQAGFVPFNIGNPDLGPERTRELEIGFESAHFNERLSLGFSYYDQVTDDALLGFPQELTKGVWRSQITNVGEVETWGIELEASGIIVQRPNFSLELGASFSTINSKVTDMDGVEPINVLLGYQWVEEGQPLPVYRGPRILNPDEFADPEVEANYHWGPSVPTHIISPHINIGLPGGLRLSFLGEFQGGHYIVQHAQWNMVNRGAGSPADGCVAAYSIMGHGEFDDTAPEWGQINAWQRAHCYAESQLSGTFIEPADFFKIRDLSLTVPLGRLISVAQSASLTFSVRNIRVWTHSDFSAFDPEMIWARTGLVSLTTGIPEATPAPWRGNVAFRIMF